jgi:hypothetical protein
MPVWLKSSPFSEPDSDEDDEEVVDDDDDELEALDVDMLSSSWSSFWSSSFASIIYRIKSLEDAMVLDQLARRSYLT